MPGANCAIVGCVSSRRNKGIGIFKLPAPINEFNVKWRADFLSTITSGRTVDKTLKNKIEKDTVYVCEYHFEEDEYEIVPCGEKKKKFLKKGAIPSKNLPIKSIPSSAAVPRPVRAERSCEERYVKHKKMYDNFIEVCKRVKNLKLSGWEIHETVDCLVLKKWHENHMVPNFVIKIDGSLAYTIYVYAWMLPPDHYIYKDYRRSIQNIAVSELIKLITSLELCEGVVPKLMNSKVRFHIIPKDVDHLKKDFNQCYDREEFCRSLECSVLIIGNVCEECDKISRQEQYRQNTKDYDIATPAKLSAPIASCRPERVKLALQQQRLKCTQLEDRINEMSKELRRSSVTIDNDLANDFTSIFTQHSSSATPFMKLFWDEQMKLSKTSAQGARYHPMIIRYCLSLASKSPSCYDELRYSNILRLPSRRTLRGYRNWVRPKRGFNWEVVDELRDMTTSLSPSQRYVILMMDKMKIQSNLVYEKSTGELIGFLDLGDPSVNYATIENSDTLASHVLSFIVRGIAVNLLFSFAHFATNGVTSLQIMPLFWDAVSIFEITCKLWVIATACDGASPNRRFFKFHTQLSEKSNIDSEEKEKTVYKVVNLFKPERYILFFADAPHLLKTSRNCLAHSGEGNYPRLLWNNGSVIVWKHITDLFYEDLERDLKLLPKLTFEHISLNCFSSMRVNLAVQILSSTVGNVLSKFGPKEAHATATFCKVMDTFFDYLNIRSTKEYIAKNKDALKPFPCIDDDRLLWLKGGFLDYFEQWKKSIRERTDKKFTKAEQNRMFLSQQTYEGLKITALSTADVVKYLLSNGVSYVLTERFSQDPVEEYFGHQRRIGRRSDNPDLRAFGYNDNNIRIQGSLAHIPGNMKGKYNVSKTKWVEVEEKSLKKRKYNKCE